MHLQNLLPRSRANRLILETLLAVLRSIVAGLALIRAEACRHSTRYI